MERNEFIKQCGIVCFSAIGLTAFLQSCKSAFYAPNALCNNQLVVKKSDFGIHKYVLVKNETLPAPIYLNKKDESQYVALLMLCTHKGCELNPAGELLICPCHGSEFSNAGQVLSPPADKNLAKFSVTVDSENIYIQL